jgi:hypothetical protein
MIKYLNRGKRGTLWDFRNEIERRSQGMEATRW